jgi:hypothetical protein
LPVCRRAEARTRRRFPSPLSSIPDAPEAPTNVTPITTAADIAATPRRDAVVESFGLQPVAAPPLLDPITEDDVGVVCWMAVLPSVDGSVALAQRGGEG